MKPKVAWYIPPLLLGSGGILNMFQKANALASAGFECHMYIEDKTDRDLQELVNLYYGDFDLVYFRGLIITGEYDAFICTMFYSVFLAKNLGKNCPIIYFNQDYEALFHDQGVGYLVGQNCYEFATCVVTSGRWLSHLVSLEFGQRCFPLEIGADNETYFPLDNTSRENAVCFIYQPEKFRRCPDLGINALRILKEKRPDVTIYTFGSPGITNLGFDTTHLGLLPSGKEINELYNRCKAGLCISSTNPSRVPFEMVSAGLPVVDIYRYNNLLDLPDQGFTLAYQSSESIAYALQNLIEDEEKWHNTQSLGIAEMRRRPLQREHAMFVNAVSMVVHSKPFPSISTPLSFKNEPIISSSEAASKKCHDFCLQHRNLALRTILRQATDDIESNEYRSKDLVQFPNITDPIFNDIRDWSRVPTIGHEILSSINLYEYKIHNNCLTQNTHDKIGNSPSFDCNYFVDLNKPLFDFHPEFMENSFETLSLSHQFLSNVNISARPQEWSGVNLKSHYLSLHPNGWNPSIAEFCNAVTKNTIKISVTAQVAHADSPPIQFSVGISNYSYKSKEHQPRDSEVDLSPFITLKALETKVLNFYITHDIKNAANLLLLTRHEHGCKDVLNSHARFFDIKFLVSKELK